MKGRNEHTRQEVPGTNKKLDFFEIFKQEALKKFLSMFYSLSFTVASIVTEDKSLDGELLHDVHNVEAVVYPCHMSHNLLRSLREAQTVT